MESQLRIKFRFCAQTLLLMCGVSSVFFPNVVERLCKTKTNMYMDVIYMYRQIVIEHVIRFYYVQKL